MSPQNLCEWVTPLELISGILYTALFTVIGSNWKLNHLIKSTLKCSGVDSKLGLTMVRPCLQSAPEPPALDPPTVNVTPDCYEVSDLR